MGRKYARAACWGKASYATRTEAVATATLVTKRGHGMIIPYRCRECHAWHIGHGKPAPDPRIDPKQWKNWHWRKPAD